MDFPTYARIRDHVAVPHVLDVDLGGRPLRLLGIRHTHDPSHPQMRWLVREIRAWRPSSVLVEGGLPEPYASLSDSVAAYGERGVVVETARRLGVPCSTIEAWRIHEAVALWPEFGRERTKLFYVLRDFNTWRRGPHPVRRERHVRSLMDNQTRAGVLGRPRTLAELKEAVRTHLPEAAAWWDVPLHWFDPVAEGRWTHAAARASNAARDHAMMGRLIRAAERGRPLAVLGFTHTVMQAPSWRELGTVTEIGGHQRSAILP